MVQHGSASGENVRFTGVWVFRKDLVYVRAVIPALEEQQIEHAAMFRFDGSSWTQYMVRSPGVAHCVIPENERTVLTLSPFGAVHIAKPNGFSWEQLDTMPGGPNTLRQMRDIRPVGGKVYAVGMDHMVYVRERPGTWKRLNDGLPTERQNPSGFLAIDGYSEELLYAVGFRGDMCFYNGRNWSQIESPTNVKIERVRCVSPQLAVACGASGLVLIGTANRWDVITQTLTKAVFWGLEYFQGIFYLATTEGVFTLRDQDLERVEFGLPGPITTARLHSADGVLWSVGANDMLVFDGSTWSRRELPVRS